MPLLPADVIADIVDQLADDVDALHACSTISRSWTHSTRVHLFKTVSLYSLSDNVRFTDFVSFLHQSPAVGGFIRHLRLVSSPLHRRYSSAARVLPSLLTKLLSLLPHLNAVEFCGVSFAGAQYEQIPAKTLHLENVTFTDVGVPGGLDTALDWSSILAVFSSVGELCLRTELPHVHRLPPSLPASVLSAATVKLQDVTRPGILLQYLSTTALMESLTSLDVAILIPEHIGEMGSFLRSPAGGDSVQDLRLDLSKFHLHHHRGLSSLPWTALHLNNLDNLRCLTLVFSLDPSVFLSFSDIPGILVSVANPHLRRLTIVAVGSFQQVQPQLENGTELEQEDVFGFSSLARKDLMQIEDVMLEQMRDLEEVVVDLSGAVWSGTGTRTADSQTTSQRVQDYVRASMAKLWKKNILAVRPPMSRIC